MRGLGLLGLTGAYVIGRPVGVPGVVAGRVGANGGVAAGELTGTRTAISSADDAATIPTMAAVLDLRD